MSRIRSVHPGLFTDEVFMGASAFARILLIGLWTEADDQGIFEWKPLTLKARLLPVDSVDVVELLSELETANAICRFQVQGKVYGAVRNFRKYQRPQKPTAQHPLPDRIATYVCMEGSSPVEVKEDYNTDTIKSPQMEDGVGEEDVKEEDTAQAPVSDPFDDFWKVYPKREGDNPKKPARLAFSRALKRGGAPDAMIAAAKRLASKHPTPTPYVPQAVTWLNQDRWADQDTTGPPNVVPFKTVEEIYAEMGIERHG